MRIFDTHCHLGLLYEDPVSQIRAIDEAKRGLALDKDKTKQANVIALANISTNLYDFASCYKNTKNIQENTLVLKELSTRLGTKKED